MTKVALLLISMLFLTGSPQSDSQNNDGYTIIYSADKDGKALSGSLEELVRKIQNGSPIRVGWILKFNHPETGDLIEMQHWADAGFITTLKGHVFAQIHSIYQQGPALGDPPWVILVNNLPNGWVAVVGTTGEIRQKFNDPQMPEEFIKEMELMRAPTLWAAIKD